MGMQHPVLQAVRMIGRLAQKVGDKVSTWLLGAILSSCCSRLHDSYIKLCFRDFSSIGGFIARGIKNEHI